MKTANTRLVRVVALLLAVVVVAALSAAIGATGTEATITAQDEKQMRDYVDAYWMAMQHSWPVELRNRDQKTLSSGAKAEMRRARRDTAERVTTGRLAAWEEQFDPGGFLEEMRESGTIVTATGYEILEMSEPTLSGESEAQAVVKIRTWSEQYEVDGKGAVSGSPYRTTNDNTYRYTFEKVDGRWRLSVQDLLSSPL